MLERPILTSLNDLRNSAEGVNNNIAFKKLIFGGYNTKEVSAYVKTLKDSLQNAERSFNNRLEEYASISAMHKQESDKYMKMLDDAKLQISQFQQKVKALNEENDGLNVKINELSDNSLNQNEMQLYEDMQVQNEGLKNKLNEYEDYKFEDIELKSMNSQLQNDILELNEQIEINSINENIKEEYEIVISENELLKQNYDETMSENSVLTADKNVLIEQNKRISDNLTQSNEKNKELRDMITKIKLRIRRNMAESQARVYEGSQKHQLNIEQITDSIKNALNILQYESIDISKLLDSTNEEIDLELDNKNAEKIELNS